MKTKENITCRDCGQVINPKSATPYQDGYICNECLRNGYFTCSDCGRLYPLELRNTVNPDYSERYVCNNCRERYTLCTHCNNYFSHQYIWASDDDFAICGHCSSDYVFCDDCECIVARNDANQYDGEYYCANIKVPKTPKSNRNIPILEVLEPYLKAAIQNKNADDMVFCKDNGAIYDKSGIQMLFRNFNKQYNEYIGSSDSPVHFTMHQFRHTFCTILYNAGVDVKIAQDLLGHSSVNVTLGIYTHLSREIKKTGTDKINEYIENQSVKNQSK